MTISLGRLTLLTNLGMAEPKHLVLPDGMVSSGWPSVRDTCRNVGIEFDPWQVDLNRPMLSKTADGLYAADTVVMSICRQSGKTYDVGGVSFADSIINPGSTTVWTAHRFSVARETFNELKTLATLPKMAPHVDPDAITTATGNECIPFRNGSRILFKARERGALRGFTKVRRLILDEAQILTEQAMADLIPTMNHAVNPQVILLGTPPKPSDPSEVFTSLRQDALEGKTEGVLYVEYGADADCDLDDWDAVAQANPSYPLRTGKRSIERMRKLLTSDEDYAREALGIWDASGSGTVIDPDAWVALEDVDSKPDGRVVFALDMPPNRSDTSIMVAGHRPDGLQHVELVDHRRGTGWVVDRCKELKAKWRCEFTLDPSSPAGSLLTELQEAGIEPVLVSGREMGQACGFFYDAVTDKASVRHLGQPKLNVAVDAGRKRTMQDAWAWHRRDTSSDISPLVGATLALYVLGKPPKRKERSGKAMFA